MMSSKTSISGCEFWSNSLPLLCFQISQAISRKNVSKPLLISLCGNFLVSSHQSCSVWLTWLKVQVQPIQLSVCHKTSLSVSVRYSHNQRVLKAKPANVRPMIPRARTSSSHLHVLSVVALSTHTHRAAVDLRLRRRGCKPGGRAEHAQAKFWT